VDGVVAALVEGAELVEVERVAERFVEELNGCHDVGIVLIALG